MEPAEEVLFEPAKHAASQVGGLAGQKRPTAVGFLAYPMPSEGAFDSAATAKAAKRKAAAAAKAAKRKAAAAAKATKRKTAPAAKATKRKDAADANVSKGVVAAATTVSKGKATKATAELTDESDAEEERASLPPDYHINKYKSRFYTSKKSQKKFREKAGRAGLDAYISQ